MYIFVLSYEVKIMNSTRKIYRITALFMAALMFLTSVGFTVDMHYCQGNIKSFSFFGKAKNCYELANLPTPCQAHKKTKPPPTNGGIYIDKKECCHNKSVYFHADLNQRTQSADFVLSQSFQPFFAAFVYVFLPNKFVETNMTSFAFYTPPPIPRDISVLLQTFLL